MLTSGVKIQYLCTLVCEEALHQFDTFYYEVGSDTPENLTSIILGLGTYFLPVNVLPNKKRAMPRRMSTPWGLKVRCYYAFPIDIKNYVGVLPDAKEKDKICMAELDEFLLNSIPNIWNRQ